MADINSLQLRNDVVETIPSDMDLPEQMGSFAPTLMPGVDNFRIPVTVGQCWDVFDQTQDADKNPLASPIQRVKLKFDRENPLVVVGGERDGGVLQATISSLPRKRGKKDSDAPSVADLTYFLRESLQDKTAIQNNRQWVETVNKHAGELVRLEHGLSGYCNPDKNRYVDDGNGGTVEDPSGTKGCGKRHYTSAFKLPEGGYGTEVQCECGAIVRGFAQIERFLKPTGVR